MLAIMLQLVIKLEPQVAAIIKLELVDSTTEPELMQVVTTIVLQVLPF